MLSEKVTDIYFQKRRENQKKGAGMERFFFFCSKTRAQWEAEEWESELAVSWCIERRVITAVGTRGE